MKAALNGLLFLMTVLPPSSMTFTTRLSHTAVWAGDQFHYLITVDYPADYEFVLDNLAKETVNMDPFQVIDVRKEAVAQKDSHWKLFVDLTLANFTSGQSTVQIPQFTLYYFRKGTRTAGADQAEAESLTIPGPTMGIRSTLTAQPEDIRDAIAMTSWERNRWVLPAVGWICSVALVLLACRQATRFVRNLRAQKGPDRRKAMESVRIRWAGIVPSDFTDPEACSKFYSLSSQALKEYIGYYLDTPTAGLTAEEMGGEMQRLGSEPDVVQKVTKVLEVCERWQYAARTGAADAAAARSVADDMREIFKLGMKL